MHTVLVTGFDACAGDPPNPTEQLIAGLRPPAGVRLERLLLPTIYGQADRLLTQTIEAAAPAAVLMFGVSAKADPLVVELVARNADTSPKLDNLGRPGAVDRGRERRRQSSACLASPVHAGRRGAAFE